MAGLPGTGKSTLARELAARTHGVVLSKDDVRCALFPPELIEYSTRQDDFCMEIMLQTAAYLARPGNFQPIFFDGRTFSRRYQLERIIAVAESLGQPWRVIECVCSEEAARSRLAKDQAMGLHAARNRDFDLYLQVKARFEKITLPKIVIDTNDPLERCVERGLGAFL